MINLDNLNPDWEDAARHGKASEVGYNVYDKLAGNNVIVCPCCLQHVFKQPVPLLVNSKQLQFLGFGFPLFYSFLKNCIILVIILICSYNAISLKKAIDYNYQFCHGGYKTVYSRLLAASSTQGEKILCTSFMVEMSRIQYHVSTQETILRIASFIVQMLFLIYMRDHLTKLEAYYDERNTSLSDYSIILKHIPRQKYIQQKLRQFFLKAFMNQHEIKQITLIPQYPQLDELKRQRAELIEKLRLSYKKDQSVELTEQQIKEQDNLKKVEKAIQEEIIVSKNMAKNDQLQCEKVILVFNTDQQKQEIISEFIEMDFSKRGPYFGVGSQEITISQSPQPKQILWDNINVGKKKRFGLRLISWGLSLLVLLAVTVVFYFILDQKSGILQQAYQKLKKDKTNEKYKTNYNLAVALVYFLLILVMIFNKMIMSVWFFKFTEIQRNQTRSKFEFSFCLKYLLGLFFTTALMTLAVEAITLNNYFSHAYGVVEQETVMFFLNAFFTPLYWLINPSAIFKSIKRWYYHKKKHLTQKQANNIMQKAHYDMGKRYAQVIQTLWFTFLYSTLIPVGAFISLAGLFLYYWVDKYNLLRRSSISGQVSGKMVLKCLKLLDLTLLLKPAGQILFDIQVHFDHVPLQSIIMLVIGFLYFILPTSRIITIVNPQMFHLEQKSYQEVKQKFKDTYHTEHPVYKIIHAQKMRRKLTKRGISFDNISNQSPFNNTEMNLIQTSGNQQTNPTPLKKPSLSPRKKQFRQKFSTTSVQVEVIGNNQGKNQTNKK